MNIVKYTDAPFTPEHRAAALDVISSAYGDRYDPVLASDLFARASGCVEVRNHLGVTASLAIVSSNKRILMSASACTTDRTKKIESHKEVLKACHDGNYATWVTIGESYKRVQALMAEAGMERVDDEAVAGRLLEGLNADGPQYSTDTEGGLVVVSQHDSKHPGYRQQIWQWIE